MFDMTRRMTLMGLTSSAFVWPSLASASQTGHDDLHVYAARQAKDLANGRDIELGLLLPQGCGLNLAPIIASFKKMSGIVVRPIEVPVDDINTRLMLDTLAGEVAYDLALPATFGLPDLVSSGSILPLTAYVERHEPIGFREGILYTRGDNFDQDVFGFQTDGDAYMMFYHKDLLEDKDENKRFADRFGHALETPQTWDELDRQIAYFNRPDEGLGGGLLFRTPEYVAWEWWVRFHAKGVWPMSKDLVPQIASDAGITALEELIRVTQHLCPETSTLGLFGNWERYARGDVYCNIGWGGSQKYFNGASSKMKGRLCFGPTPGGMVDGEILLTPYFNWGWNYVVSSSTSRPEISYLFALFASSSEMSTLAVRQEGGFFDPFRPEHYRDPKIREVYSDAFLRVHADSMMSAIPDLYLAQQGEYFRILGNWLMHALRGEVSPEIALSRVSEGWELTSLRADREMQADRWRRLRDKYPPNVREKLRDL